MLREPEVWPFLSLFMNLDYFNMSSFITDKETEEWDLMDYIDEDDNDVAKRCKET